MNDINDATPSDFTVMTDHLPDGVKVGDEIKVKVADIEGNIAHLELSTPVSKPTEENSDSSSDDSDDDSNNPSLSDMNKTDLKNFLTTQAALHTIDNRPPSA